MRWRLRESSARSDPGNEAQSENRHFVAHVGVQIATADLNRPAPCFPEPWLLFLVSCVLSSCVLSLVSRFLCLDFLCLDFLCLVSCVLLPGSCVFHPASSPHDNPSHRSASSSPMKRSRFWQAVPAGGATTGKSKTGDCSISRSRPAGGAATNVITIG